MKKSTTKLGFIILIGIIALALMPIKSYAVLQASGSGTASYTIDNWLGKVREMESAGGTFGKTEEFDTENTEGKRFLSITGSNKLDCHMEKNTEYGAMALLSASAYGNPSKINSSETTTGNATGVYIYLNNEIVSAGSITAVENYVKADDRYKNFYTTNYEARKGDAISETAGWHGGATGWIYGWDGDANWGSTLLRGNGSVFGYYGNGGSFYARAGGDAPYWRSHPTRAVVVIGEGF